jgi:hypothetical protein
MVSSGMCLVTHCYVRDMTQLAAKDEITGALLRYTRGIDRLDGDLHFIPVQCVWTMEPNL